MQIVKSTIIRDGAISGLSTLHKFSLNTTTTGPHTISIFASGLVRTDDFADDGSQFLTGFNSNETESVWTSTFRYARPGGDFTNFAVTGAATIAFRDIDIFWRVWAPNNPMRLTACSLIVGLSTPGVEIEVLKDDNHSKGVMPEIELTTFDPRRFE